MASAGVNVLRYSALGLGVCYGLYHQSSISTQVHAARAEREFQSKSGLIQKAKAEYLKKNMPKDKVTSGGGVISDPEDPKFDLEAYLTTTMAEGK